MKLALILNAIQALDRARRLLRVGDGSMHDQMRAADDCSHASVELRSALERECPEIKIEDAAR